jgi:hypothetical protein
MLTATIIAAMATATSAPPATWRSDRIRFVRSASTTESIVPRIGVIKGATIMAPITVAVESAATPAAAIMDARVIRIQNRLNRCRTSVPSKNTASRMCCVSFITTIFRHLAPGYPQVGCLCSFLDGSNAARDGVATCSCLYWGGVQSYLYANRLGFFVG